MAHDLLWLTHTGEHVPPSPGPTEGDVIHLLVVGNQLGLHMTRDNIHTTQYLPSLYKHNQKESLKEVIYHTQK